MIIMSKSYNDKDQNSRMLTIKFTADFKANLSCKPRPATENVIMPLNISDGKEYNNNGHFLRN
jgi:hypothetical protein